jgi:hypothetical protein
MRISNIEKESVAIGEAFEVVENLRKKDDDENILKCCRR